MATKRASSEPTNLNPVTWAVWTAVVAALAILARNPLYLSLLLGIVVIHYVTASQARPEAQGQCLRSSGRSGRSSALRAFLA